MEALVERAHDSVVDPAPRSDQRASELIEPLPCPSYDAPQRGGHRDHDRLDRVAPDAREREVLAQLNRPAFAQRGNDR